MSEVEVALAEERRAEIVEVTRQVVTSAVLTALVLYLRDGWEGELDDGARGQRAATLGRYADRHTLIRSVPTSVAHRSIAGQSRRSP